MFKHEAFQNNQIWKSLGYGTKFYVKVKTNIFDAVFFLFVEASKCSYNAFGTVSKDGFYLKTVVEKSIQIVQVSGQLFEAYWNAQSIRSKQTGKQSAYFGVLLKAPWKHILINSEMLLKNEFERSLANRFAEHRILQPACSNICPESLCHQIITYSESAVRRAPLASKVFVKSHLTLSVVILAKFMR